jgi:hypothetical protein
MKRHFGRGVTVLITGKVADKDCFFIKFHNFLMFGTRFTENLYTPRCTFHTHWQDVFKDVL